MSGKRHIEAGTYLPLYGMIVNTRVEWNESDPEPAVAMISHGRALVTLEQALRATQANWVLVGMGEANGQWMVAIERSQEVASRFPSS